jgi:hypothetical protein
VRCGERHYPTHQASRSLHAKGSKEGECQFTIRSGDHEDDPDVRWSHLPDEDAARRYGHLLIKDFKSSGRYADASHLYVVVKDEMGNPLISIPFRDIV